MNFKVKKITKAIEIVANLLVLISIKLIKLQYKIYVYVVQFIINLKKE